MLNENEPKGDDMTAAAKSIKIPGPDHPITTARNPNRVVVTFAGHVIAETQEAFTLKEANYPPVIYVPRKDANMALLKATEHSTYCPYKGDASYFSISAGGREAVNAIWSYEHPHPAMAVIADYLAFYPDRVDAIEERAGV
jgi:uncharacterized protein (DUF427 family)